MLSRLPWQKRSSTSSIPQSKPGRGAESKGSGVATPQSQGADPSTQTTYTDNGGQQPSQQRGSLIRSRSQRFSRQSLAEGFNRLTGNRHSYVGSTGSRSQLGFEDDPPRIPSHPDVTPFVPPPHTDSAPQLLVAVDSSAELDRLFRDDSTPSWSSPLDEYLQALPQPRNNIQATTQSLIDDQLANRAGAGFDSMSIRTASASAPGKTSSESAASSAGLDRWSQRRLQRLNAEQGFREQRQGTAVIPTYGDQQQELQQQPQQVTSPGQPAANSIYSRPQTENGLNYSQGPSSPLRSSATSNAPSLTYHDASKYRTPQITSPSADANTTYQPTQSSNNNTVVARSLPLQRQASNHSHRSQAREVHNQTLDGAGVASSNDHPQSASRVPNRQSTHSNNGGNTNANSNPITTAQIPPVTATARSIPVLQTRTAAPSVQSKDLTTPMSSNEDMTEDEVRQLVADHKELREKYNKVKKYYFEKEDQVKALQNSLAHQKIAQSRTSLDDSEYATRFNRLDGLIAQLSFSIRKNWKTVPEWLMGSINKDAITIGKQEMTAAGRAIVSRWLVDEVFSVYFHPDLDIKLSSQLKTIQRNLRRAAPIPANQEDEEYLTAKIVSWRLATLDGLSDMFRSPQCANNRDELIELLKGQLTSYLSQHLDNPPLSDLEGGVHMIIELAVAMVAHLPLESRDVQIEYFKPSSPINYDQMKAESGIPSLGVSLADEMSERASDVASIHSNMTEDTKNGDGHHRKRDMLSALTGGGKKRDPKSASSSSLDVSRGHNDKDEPKVRMAVGIAAFVRNRTVLVKAPVFAS